VFTNLSSEHLDYHKTLDQYFEAKAKLFAMLGTKQKRGRAVVNTDDVYGRKLAGRLDGGNAVLTYGVSGEPAVCARDVRVAADGTRFVALTPRGPIPVAIPMIGRFNVSNALAAVATGLALGVDPASITQGLANMRRVPGRLERVAPDQAFNVFVDYAHTAEALRNVLATVGEITAGRVLAVFGCGGDRDKTKRQPMGWAGCELADFSILTSDNPRTEDPREILRQVATGFLPGSESRYMVIEDRREAIERALDIARPGDTVLIAGKGHETYQEFADTVVPFNDRQVIEDYLDQSRYITWLRAAGGRPGSPADKEQTRCA
jgi:UDP-N-acetylmuramoyl-L-alanyl-D-glutamate--2,6-diaminopimelate ligase